MYTLPIKNVQRRGVTLVLVLALMVMFAMLVTTFMVIVSLNRRNADLYAGILLGEPPEIRVSGIVGGGVQENGALSEAFQLLLTGNLGTIVGPHSILENLYGYSSDGLPFGGTGASAEFALRPNILAPNDNGVQEYKEYLQNNDVRMNPNDTVPDYSSMFLAWNDVRSGELRRIIPSFHRPQLVTYWDKTDDPTELRKYVLRPLPTDHPEFTGSNPAANKANLHNFLINGPWDVDCDGDGKADSVWLDIGLPPRQDSTEKWYKPLVAFHVIDMDGRINVNTFGNLAQYESAPDLSGLGIANVLTNNNGGNITGTGLGTAELTSSLLTKEVLASRYGSDKPDVNNDDLLRNNGINFEAYTQGGLLADWFGFSPIMFDTLGNRVVVEPTVTDIPYLLEPYDGGDDHPFQPDALEPLLRSIVDLDYNRLPLQLRELLGDQFDPKAPTLTTPDRRYSLTTRSSDIPVAAGRVPVYDDDGKIINYITFEEHVKKLGGEPLWNLLSAVTRRGEKVNLNWLTLRDDWMTSEIDLLKAKAKFAQEIFYLLQVLLPEERRDVERLAQWSVNLVDFIDPDDVMTPFIFRNDDTPEDCTDKIDELLAGTLNLPSNYTLVWGFEKPEVALTKTFAVHDRRVTPGLNNDSQDVRPQGSLFVQLYRQGNRQRSYTASRLVESDGTLNLAKKTDGGDYLWRLAIGKAAKTDAGQFKWNEDNAPEKNALRQLLTPENGEVKYPQFSQWATGTSDGQYHPDLGAPERYIWFGKTHPPVDDEIRRCSFVNHDESDVVLDPDSLLVIAPRLLTGFDSLGSIDLDGVNTMTAVTPLASGDNVGVNVSEDSPTGLTNQLSDAYEGRFGSHHPPPADTGILYQRGTIACYKTICLQRLADPTRPYHSICNPYLTVDWNMIDLQVINSLDLDNEEGVPEDKGDICFVPRRWKEETASGFFNLWDRTLTESVFTDDKAGLEKNLGLNTFDDSPRTKSLLYFPWHDAPLMNTGELMLVPASAPGRFGVEFHDSGTDKDFFGEEPRFSFNKIGPYLNWTDHLAGTPADMPHLFHFVHVPSRFTRAIANKREPGKINLNTVTEEGWEALRNGRDHFPSYADFRVYRESKQGDFSGTSGSVTLFDLATEVSPSLIDDAASNPYTILENIMRLSDVTTTRSNVFAVWITVGYFNVEKFVVDRERDEIVALENKDILLKTKHPGLPLFGQADSLAMFEAVYPDGCVLGTEKGLDDGTVRRYRAFYLIDRSIPVDFSRGDIRDMNNVILKQTLLE